MQHSGIRIYPKDMLPGMRLYRELSNDEKGVVEIAFPLELEFGLPKLTTGGVVVRNHPYYLVDGILTKSEV